MAITSTGLNAATNAEYAAANTVKDKTALGKDDFMKLLLVELQHQDPTEPMDSEKILTQTSQLAGLESSENTNKALATLTAGLGNCGAQVVGNEAMRNRTQKSKGPGMGAGPVRKRLCPGELGIGLITGSHDPHEHLGLPDCTG